MHSLTKFSDLDEINPSKTRKCILLLLEAFENHPSSSVRKNAGDVLEKTGIAFLRISAR